MSGTDWDAIVASGATDTPADSAARSGVDWNAIVAGSNGQQQMRQSLYGATRVNPDEYGRAKKVERETGLPAPIAARNLSDVEFKAKLGHFDQYTGTVLGTSLANPDFASLAHDDAPNLDAVQKTVRPPVKPVVDASGFSQLVYSLMKSSPALDLEGARFVANQQVTVDNSPGAGLKSIDRSAIEGLTEPFARGQARYRLGQTLMASEVGLYNGANAELAVRVAAQQRDIEKYAIPPTVQQGMQEIGGADTFGKAFLAAVNNPRAVRETIIESLGSYSVPLLATLGASAFGPGGTATSAGANSFALEYASTLADVMGETGKSLTSANDVRQLLENKDLMSKARDKAMKRGIAVGVFDAMTAGLAGRLLAGAKPTAVSIGSRVLGEGVLQAGGGAAGEATAQAVTGEFKPGDILMEALGEIPGGIMEAHANTAHAKAAARTHDLAQAGKAQSAIQNVESLEQLGKLSETSKVRTRDAPSFSQFVDQAAEGGNVQELYINANTLMQAAGERLPEVLKASPSIAAQIDDALRTGGDVHVPLGEYTSGIGATDLNNVLSQHVRTDPDAMTKAEAEEFMQQRGEEFKQQTDHILEQKEFDTHWEDSRAVVEREMLTQLKDANRFTEDVNRPYATLLSSFYATQAARLGMTPEQMYVRYPVQIRAESPLGEHALSQGERARLVFGDDITAQPSTIALLKAADLSSFQHEVGHLQLEVLSHMAAQPDAPAGVAEDMGKVLDWFGVKDNATWRAMPLKEKEHMHEKFARGFEAYLFEGKAPSQGLSEVFGKLRAWLLNVYRNLRALNVELSDEVRAVYDRLLATNEEIQAQEALRGLMPLFEKAPDGTTPAEWAAYQSLSADATQEAVDQLQTRSLRDMQYLSNARGRELKRLQREASSKRKAVAAEVTTEVQAEPVYSVQRFLHTGEMVAPDGDLVKIEKGFRLDTAALAEMYPESMLARPDLGKLHGLTSKEGLHPDLVAEMFGFPSGDALVRSITETEPEASVIEGMTEQRMLERYGQLQSPDAISRAADEAVHNAVRSRFAATEYKMATNAVGSVRQIAAAAREMARKSIAQLKLADIRPKQYAAAEARAAKLAIKERSDPAKFAAAVRERMLSNALTREAYSAVDYVGKSVEYLRHVGDSQTIDVEYREQIQAMLARFDLRQVSAKDAARRQNLAAWAEQQTAQGMEPDIAPELLDEARRQPYRTLDLESFKGLVDAVRNIEHLGRLKHKLLTAVDQRDFDTAVGELVQTIEENAKKTIPTARASNQSLLVKTASLFRSAFAAHRKFASLAQEFDGFKSGGKAWDYLVRNMNAAGDFETAENAKATEHLVSLLEPVMQGESMKAARTFDFNGRQVSFTRMERIGLLLNMGNETNVERILTGERITPEQLRQVVATLTPADLAFANKVWDYLDSFRPAMAEKQRRLTGNTPEWVEAQAFTLKLEDGTEQEMRGGYYPIASDPNLSERSHADLNAEVANQIKGGFYTRAQTRRGHLKARVESTGRTLRYDFANVLSDHVGKVVHDLAWHEYLLDSQRLLAHSSVEEAIRDHYGVEVLRNMKGLLTDVAIGGLTVPQAMDPWFNHIRYGATIAGLGFNVSNTIINLVGITQSMSKLGTGWVARGLVHWAADPEGGISSVYEKSEFMKNRGVTQNRELNELRNKVRGSDSKLEAAYFWLQSKTQVLVDMPTWWGGYEKAMAQDNMTEDKAIALADQAVIDAQGSGQIKDLAAVQRGNSAMKAFTSFFSFFSTTYGLTAEAYGRTDFKKPGDILLFAADMALLYTIPALVGTLVKAALKGEDDPDKLKKKIIADQMSYLLGTMIFLREATAGIQEAAGVGEGFGYTGPASVRLFADVFKLGQQIKQGEADASFWKALNNVGGVLFHYPSGALAHFVEGAYAMKEGRTQNPGALLVGPPAKH